MAHSVVLDLLSVDPEHQSAGAGTKLINWGLEKADEMGAEVNHEMSSAGAKAKMNPRP